MKMHRFACLAGLTFLASTACLQAAPVPDHMGEHSLIESRALPRLSLGANVELLARDITVDDRLDGTLEGSAYSGYVGVDATRWLTVFGTAGAIFLDSLKTPGVTDDFDSGLRWSAGLNASLWHVDLKEPEFARGRLSIGATIEYQDSEASGTEGDVSWSDFAIAVPLGFEIPNDPMYYLGVHSLYLFAGPIYSQWDGSLDQGSGSLDFEANQDMGVLAGADIYMARNVSIGGHLQIFDSTSATLSARYHF